MSRLHPLARLLGYFSWSLLLTSCSFIVDMNAQQCTADADCGRLGLSEHRCVDALCVEQEPKVDPRFACQDTPWPEPNNDRKVNYSIVVERLIGSTPYEGLEVLACPSFDSQCKRPITKDTSDSKGRVDFSLPVGFRGHLYAMAPKKDPTIVPVAAYMFPPPSEDDTGPKRKSLVIARLEVIRELTKQGGEALDLEAAHLIFTAMGCDDKPLEGIRVTTSESREDTWEVYVGSSGQIDPERTKTGPSGRGAILNLPPGFITVTGTHPEAGKVFEETVYILPSTMNSVIVVPSPLSSSNIYDNSSST